MEANWAIRADGIGKRYVLGSSVVHGYRTLRDDLTAALSRPFRRSRHDQTRGGALWALRNVSFHIAPGEVVGLIGRNGAGKSTLLKVLSRITEPTVGRAEIRGRVASLLEIGTGMHGELTGRENIYLGGIILGMSKADVDRRFDEIVTFAEVERFLDTPIKRYSSGMYLRLAFAVAAHLEPNILLVDEVLAVGDAAFQRKCLGKMQDVGSSGRTVVFVSHSMPAITRICQRTLLLAEGALVEDGPSAHVVATYLRSGLGTRAEREWADLAAAPGDDVARLRAIRVVDETGTRTERVDVRRPVGIQVEFDVLRPGYPLIPEIGLFNDQGLLAFAALDTDRNHTAVDVGRYRSTAWVPGNLLAEGIMSVHVAIITAVPQMQHALFRDAVAFLVTDPLEGSSARGEFAGNMKGVLRPLLRWEREFASF